MSSVAWFCFEAGFADFNLHSFLGHLGLRFIRKVSGLEPPTLASDLRRAWLHAAPGRRGGRHPGSWGVQTLGDYF